MKTEKQEAEVHEALEKIELNEHSLPVFEIVDTLKRLDLNHSYIGQVEKFMDDFKQVKNTTPTTPSSSTILFRLELLLEELAELSEASGKEIAEKFTIKMVDTASKLHAKVITDKIIPDCDKIKVLDALADLQYVLSGAILTFGMQDKFDAAFELVHESNMTKACSSFQEAQETQRAYEAKGVSCFIDVTDFDKGIWRVLRTGDRKLLKSINYKRANISELLYPSEGEVTNGSENTTK